MNHRQKPCPMCHQPMDERSKICRNCFANGKSVRVYSERHERPLTGPRKGVATFDPLTVDRDWALQFCGLFMGEGSIGLRRVGPRSKLPTPTISLTQRADDHRVLEDIQAHLGGSVFNITKPHPTSQSKPQTHWGLTGYVRVKAVCELLLRYCQIPARKMFDVQLVYDFILWRETIPTFPTIEQGQYAQAQVDRLIAWHKYVVVKELDQAPA